MSASILQLYKTISRKPFGHWLFSRAVCFKAPYFGSIKPRMIVLQPNRAEATIKHRRSVTNHLGTVHAIALCNLAEFTGGLLTDVSIPSSMRWIYYYIIFQWHDFLVQTFVKHACQIVQSYLIAFLR